MIKHLLSTFRKKWPDYLIESVVIIASILGAFTLDNWNENRIERLEEQKILTSIHAEFAQNRLDLKKVLGEKQRALESGTTIMKLMGASPDTLRQIDLDKIFFYLLPANPFAPSTNSISNVVQSGKLNYLSNRELVNSLYSWEHIITKIEDRESSLDRWVAEQILPIMAAHISFKEMDSNAGYPWTGKSKLKKDYAPLFQNLTFENNMDNMLFILKGNIMGLQKADSVMIEIIELTK